jgi:hypothetical protein
LPDGLVGRGGRVHPPRELESAGYQVAVTSHRVQAYRCDRNKPLHHWYSPPKPEDPFYDVSNIEAARRGTEQPEEIIQLIAHKDSSSWIDSPGAHDNATGTVANVEIARAVATVEPRRTVRLLFCNEEHTPWTSRFAAEAAASRGDRIIAVLNVDGLDAKSDEDPGRRPDHARPRLQHRRGPRASPPARPATASPSRSRACSRRR